MPIGIYLVFFILTSLSSFAFENQQDNLAFKNCFLQQNNTFSRSESFWKANYLPSVVVSYRYQPRQKYPSITNSWTSDIFRADDLRENNELNSVTQNSLNGERHGFWVSLRFDFDNFFVEHQNQYTWRMFERRAQKRLYQMQREYLTQKDDSLKEASLAEKVEKISNQEKLKAKLNYYCERD